MNKIAIITTHPIQYNAPFFKVLTERGNVLPKVFYTWPQAIEGSDDPDFGTKISWDIPLLEGYEWEAVTNVSPNPNSKSWKGIQCPDLIERIESFGPDIVMVYGWNLKAHFQVMRHFKNRLPVWFCGDSTLLDESAGWKTLARRMVLTWVYRHIDKAFYVGQANKAYFRKHGIKEQELVHFPHAIDNNRFHDKNGLLEKKAMSWRTELGYHAPDKVILFCGKLEQKKNPILLLDAIIQLNNERSKDQQFQLLFVGNGALEQELKNRSKALDFVKFLPFQNQSIMPIVYRLGDIFCLPSQGPGETWGLAVNEAMACGKPILVSDKVGCATDLVAENHNGFVFESGNLNDLCARLNQFMQADLIQIGHNAGERIKNWSYIQKCDALEQH